MEKIYFLTLVAHAEGPSLRWREVVGVGDKTEMKPTVSFFFVCVYFEIHFAVQKVSSRQWNDSLLTYFKSKASVVGTEGQASLSISFPLCAK